MNIFYLSDNPEEAARYHVDKHVVKMILESAQMLCTAHRLLDNKEDDRLYRSTHKNHPCSKWVRESSTNYNWLYNHFCALCDEYTYRYGKVHLTDKKLRHILKDLPKNIQQANITQVAQAMPDEYKNSDPIIAYRNYYIVEKSRFAVWSKREKPSWFNK